MPAVFKRLRDTVYANVQGDRGVFALLLLPLLLYVLGGLLNNLITPYYLSTMADPAYVYLFNSLNLVYFHSPTHIDHPGTTLQVIGALVIAVKWLLSLGFMGEGHIYNDVLMHPEEYLASVNNVLRMILFAAVYISGLKIYRLSNSLSVAILFQLVPLFNADFIFQYARVNTEILQVSLAMLISAYLYEYLTVKYSDKDPDVRVVRLGILLGAGVVTKIIFAPVVFIVVLIKGLKSKLYFLVSVVVTAFILTLPIITEYPQIALWIKKLLTNHGRYGDSGAGLPDYSTYLVNMNQLMTQAFVFEVLVVVFLLMSGYLMAKRYADRGYIRYFSVYSLIMIVTMIFVGKNVAEIKYILPMLVISACGLALLLRVAGDLLEKKSYTMALVIMLGFAGVIACQSIVSAFVRGKEIENTMAKVGVVSKKISYLKGKGCMVAMFYDAPYLVHALDFGSRWSGQKWEEPLAKLYPDAFLFNIWSAVLRKFGNDRIIPPSVIREGLKKNACIILVGSTTVEDNGFPWASRLIPVLKSGKTGVYKIISAGDRVNDAK